VAGRKRQDCQRLPSASGGPRWRLGGRRRLRPQRPTSAASSDGGMPDRPPVFSGASVPVGPPGGGDALLGMIDATDSALRGDARQLADSPAPAAAHVEDRVALHYRDVRSPQLVTREWRMFQTHRRNRPSHPAGFRHWSISWSLPATCLLLRWQPSAGCRCTSAVRRAALPALDPEVTGRALARLPVSYQSIIARKQGAPVRRLTEPAGPRCLQQGSAAARPTSRPGLKFSGIGRPRRLLLCIMKACRRRSRTN
jgi:hypothetical protein